jgi:hypothetical protein
MATARERLAKTTRFYQIIWALCLVGMFIPLVAPLGLPVVLSEPVKDYYNNIVDLPEGSVIAVSFGASASLLDEQEAQFLATWKTIFQQGHKVIFYCTTEDSPIVIRNELQVVVPESYGYTYGEDYVILPFSPLAEAGETAFAQNIRSIYTTDIQGTSLDAIPLMEDINDQSGIDLLIFQYTACTSIEWVVRQWVVPFNKPVIATTLGCCGPMAAPYYPTQVQGFLSGSGAGTELEVVSGNPGPGAAMGDAKNLGILPFIAAIIWMNVKPFIGKEE